MMFGHLFLEPKVILSLEQNDFFKNKKDEAGVIIRNKARLIVQDFNQEEVINYDETYAPVTRLEAIRMLLAYACYKDFKNF